LTTIGVAGRDPRLVRIVPAFDRIERGGVYAASFKQLARAEIVDEELVGKEQAEGGLLRIVQWWNAA
jgi:hypothetical protein